MNFRDAQIEKINLDDPDSVSQMIVNDLCGERWYKDLSEKEEELLSELLSTARTKGLNYAQFNELLLLLDQDRVSEAFFEFFFGEETITLEELKEGITKFKGFAMLRYGNFRFAYKELIQKREKELEEALRPYYETTDAIREEFGRRLAKALEIEPIERNETFYTGYLSKDKYQEEAKYLALLLHENIIDTPFTSRNELVSLGEMYKDIGNDIKRAERRALTNTDIYLTWHYMDVYVATSMRSKWEFEETFDFIDVVFNYEPLEELNLRYFDPTQSKCKNRIDKGLVEGLMLKRALCTIYMAQEMETLGKDSELAATLAQGKPVLAYVPFINIDEYAEKIKKYPLDFFKKRLLSVQAEGIFEDYRKELEQCDPNFQKTKHNFLKELDEYRSSQPFSLWDEREEKFKNECVYFSTVCALLAIAEHHGFEKRAGILKHFHPLAIQVDLQSGVANGVLVVRSPKECADLLYKILTNAMSFTIRHIGEKGEGVTILEEEISGCPFRVVTDYEKLTNTFWNFYLTSEQ